MNKINLKFDITNDSRSLKYINLNGLKISERSKNITLATSSPITQKFPQEEHSANIIRKAVVEIDGENNKITFTNRLLNIDPFDSDRNSSIKGNDNEVIIGMEDLLLNESVPFFDIEGNNNKTTLDVSYKNWEKQIEIRGNDNLVLHSTKSHIRGDRNIVQLSENVSINGNDNNLSKVLGEDTAKYNEQSFFLKGNDNSLVSIEEMRLLEGNDNMVINSKIRSIYGSKNIISNLVKYDKFNVVSGNENILSNLQVSRIIGNSNFISKRKKPVDVEKENKMIEDGKMFWSTNDHEKEKAVVNEVSKVIEEVFSSVLVK